MNILLVQDVIDSLGSHIAVLNSQGVILAANKAWKDFARANGIDEKKVGVGVNYLKVCESAASYYADPQARSVAEGIQSVLDGRKESFAIDYPCDSPGERRWFAMTVRPLTSHHKEVLVSHVDVTPFKEAERALQKSEYHFRTLFQEHSAIKLLIEPSTGRILDANNAAVAFYGWSLEELRTMGIEKINTLPLPEIRRAMAKVKEGTCRTFEFKHRRADGSVRDVEVYGNVIREGERTIMYSIIHDITERKWAEAERERLEARNRQLAKEESLRRMAGAIAHLFNNHLQSVVMGLDLLQRCDPAAAEFRECIDAASKSARDASAISTLMLTYLGQSFSMHEPVDLCDLYRRCAHELAKQLPESATLEVSLPEGPLLVSASTGLLEKVLQNLVTNAMESYPPGVRGHIEAELTRVTAQEIPQAGRIPADWSPLPGEYASLTVSDQGSGIPPENIDQVFDPFYTTKFPGRGLGLPVVLGIVTELGGALTLASRPGAGTRLQVFLPLCVSAPPLQRVTS